MRGADEYSFLRIVLSLVAADAFACLPSLRIFALCSKKYDFLSIFRLILDKVSDTIYNSDNIYEWRLFK